MSGGKVGESKPRSSRVDLCGRTVATYQHGNLGFYHQLGVSLTFVWTLGHCVSLKDNKPLKE